MVETVGRSIDAVAVAVIVVGALFAAATTLTRHLSRDGNRYEMFRKRLGRSILLGLDFLVAADIIRTVAITPTVESVLVLGGIVLIRTFLSFALELEISGAWPWQKKAIADSRA